MTRKSLNTSASYETPGRKEIAKETGIFVVETAVGTAASVIECLGPHVEVALRLASYILEVYEKAKSNKSICRVLADRADLALTSLKYLKRHLDNDFKKFQEKCYFESFMHFVEVLENIKKFTEEVSEIHGFKKFFVANSINEEFIAIRDDFDHCYKSLQLAISIDEVVNREKDDKDIKNDLNQLKEYFGYMKKNFNLS